MIIFSGCWDQIKFETPQPLGIEPQHFFDKMIQGSFVNCTNPDDKIIIERNQIQNRRSSLSKVLRKDIKLTSIDSIDANNDEQLIKYYKIIGRTIDIINDTISWSEETIDTLFTISENHVLKKFEGSYFLNYKLKEVHWEPIKMNFIGDSLCISQIIPSDNLLRFDFITKQIETDELDNKEIASYLFKPSLREFKKLLQSNVFEITECYCKMN